MSKYLLTGAGFSANWGGWVASEAFEYLLGCPELADDDRLRNLLWDYQLKGGFEDALAEVQAGHSTGFAQQWSAADLIAFQNAVGRMFGEMDYSFKSRGDLEFYRPENPLLTTSEYEEAAKSTVWHFLTRFKLHPQSRSSARAPISDATSGKKGGQPDASGIAGAPGWPT
jgi:hypothetical protein